jgi:hypothetical protein
MKILQFQNAVLSDYITQKAVLKEAVSAAGTSITLTLDDNSQFDNADLLLIGKLGKARAEKCAINAAVSIGSTIQVDALKHIHAVGEPVQEILYNQIKVYHDDNAAGSSKTLLTTIDIQFDEDFTIYVDSTNTTGYAFFSLYNSVTEDESSFSIAIPYTSLDTKTKQKIRDYVSAFYPKPFSDVVFDLSLETAQQELSSDGSFKFKEKIWTFNTVEDQDDYSFADYSLTDLGQVLSATYDTYPMKIIEAPRYLKNTAGITSSGVPWTLFIWDETLYLDPIPSEVKEVKILGYKNLSGLDDETSETDITIPAFLAFKILADFWAGSDYKKAAYYAGRSEQIKLAMQKDNDKHFDQGSGFDNDDYDKRVLKGDFTIE